MGITTRSNSNAAELDRLETGYGQRLHNRPPLDLEIVSEFKDQIAQREGLSKRIDDVLGAASRATVTDDDTFGRAGELVKQIRAASNAVSDVHKTTKEPYLAATRAIDAAKNDLVRPLDAAKASVEALQNNYAREKRRLEIEEQRKREAEQRQREAEERARLAAENPEAPTPFEEPAPAPMPVEPPKPEIVRGTFGAAVSTGKKMVAQVVDYELAFMAVSGNVKVREAIDKAIAAMVRAGQHEIPGVNVIEDVKVSNR